MSRMIIAQGAKGETMKFPIERIVRYTTDDGVHVKCEEMGEVVRCKECKWSVSLDGILGCRWHGFYETGSDWFCADAERREDE